MTTAANLATPLELSNNPSVRQGRAADPAASIWVDASAGTGKTKVLTDRVLRLLLPRPDGTAGTLPERILCLTYTSAAAAEMRIRIGEILRQWLGYDDAQLNKALLDLTGNQADAAMREAARQLFTKVIDVPGGLKVMTLHGFGQSLLRRFPIEAGVPPAFVALNEQQAAKMLVDARKQVFAQAANAPSHKLHHIIQYLARVEGDSRLLMFLAKALGERRWLSNLFTKLEHEGRTIEQLYAEKFDIEPDFLNGNYKTLLWDHFINRRKDWKHVADTLQGAGTDATNLSSALYGLLEQTSPPDAFIKTLEKPLLTDKGTPRKNLMSTAIKQGVDNLVTDLVDWFAAQNEKIAIGQMIEATVALFTLAHAVLASYDRMKFQRGLLDFDDMIDRTVTLLSNMPGWVMYKLDQGIDHVLIDEAQDTNPDQWDIINALTGDFFSGAGARDEAERTIFTVGDEKQSIYAFQRANPDLFNQQRDQYAVQVKASGREWRDIPLQTSFRTTASVLAFVDSVFAVPQTRAGMLSRNDEIKHMAYREGMAGRVELWPMVEDEPTDNESDDGWHIAKPDENKRSSDALLVEQIAATINNWLDQGRILPSRGRPVQPSDILILLRGRRGLQGALVRKLREYNIPVGGLDRIKLTDSIAVQDLLAIAKVALLPEDDLSLACALKSPLFGVDEETLFKLAYDRKNQSLWARVEAQAPEGWSNWLEAQREAARTLTPYEFFCRILHLPCPAADGLSGMKAFMGRLGPDAKEPIDALLTLALENNNGTGSLQSFIHACESAAPEVKRQQEIGAGNSVTIMTVHGSKGLQAPIVILPDTVKTTRNYISGARAENQFLWPRDSGLPLPVWAPLKPTPQIFVQGREHSRKRDVAENKRLFYVAMTRAEDELYIAGHKKNSAEMHEECWYNYAALGADLFNGEEWDRETIWSCSNPQTTEPKDKQKPAQQKPIDPNIVLPQWALDILPDAPRTNRTLSPSRLPLDAEKLEEPAVTSPLKSAKHNRFRRGNLTHTLLQHLPNVSTDQRETRGRAYLERFAADLYAELRNEILAETMALLTHADFADIFSTQGLSEVPITARLENGDVLSGQIDRLLINDDEILIVDYKTNRPPPHNVADVPAAYVAQMRAYRETLAKLYPDRTIRTALIWTDGARLMEL